MPECIPISIAFFALITSQQEKGRAPLPKFRLEKCKDRAQKERQ